MKYFRLTPRECISFDAPIHILFGKKQMAQWFCFWMRSDKKFQNVKFKAVKK